MNSIWLANKQMQKVSLHAKVSYIYALWVLSKLSQKVQKFGRLPLGLAVFYSLTVNTKGQRYKSNINVKAISLPFYLLPLSI